MKKQVSKVETTQDIIIARKVKAFEKREIKKLFIKIIEICLVIWIIFFVIYGIKVQKNQDMFPSIREGDILLYLRVGLDLNSGDIIIFNKEGKSYTSRIVAMPGDVVDISENGELIINGNVQQEEIFFDTYKIGEDRTYPYQVEEDSYFVLGDYRTESVDSRIFGTVYKDEIDGEVFNFYRKRNL
ncbi:MAG: signal peptidase I [Clostridia bacterium]|nr:signal peptidase I [Clostridia bacterium]